MRHILSARAYRALLPALIVALVLAAGSAAMAQGNSPTTFYACEGPNGTLSQISTAEQACNGNQTLVSWNQVGPIGPAGLQGEKGDTGETGLDGLQGEKGDTGEAGPVNVQLRANSLSLEAGETSTISAGCNPGEKATGGGFKAGLGFQPGNDVEIQMSAPFSDANNVPVAWFVAAKNNQPAGSEPVVIQVFVVCASS